MKWLLYAACPLLGVIELYRSGYGSAVLFGLRQWGRADWRTQDEVIA